VAAGPLSRGGSEIGGTTLALEAGGLGHATPALVMNTYGHVTDRMQKDATTAMEAALGS
jgi:hypothetical protein